MALFISSNSLAITIIKIKKVLFGKEYITISELNYIQTRLQKEFNKDRINIVINSDPLNNIVVNDRIITLANNISNNFMMLSVLGLSEYTDTIIDLIIEYAEYDLQEQIEKVSEFKSDKRDIKEKQKRLLERMLIN